ncbi:MAG TPA: chromosomal replication initiator protein DnaA [Candidatus Binatia bacterium]|nr:chromosomal replication initiator protein DnaA [Candidatus Binatia bacterium]
MESWERARNVLRDKVGDRDFETWIKPLRVDARTDGTLVVYAPSKFYRDWIVRNYLDAFRSSFASDGGASPEILFLVENLRQHELFENRQHVIDAVAAPRERADGGEATRRTAVRVGNLLPHYTFENFVVGSSNQFAHAAARAVAHRPGEKYNPLFIYGGVGVGKTHLVNAIGHAVLAKNPFARIVYVPSETFVNDLITSLRRDRMEDFKRRFRKVDLLIIDDVQFLAGRERTQEEFFHTFNSLHEAHHQIVLTSDKYPKDIPDLEERLRNRFEWGLTADIQAPEMETRVAILQKKAEIEGFDLPSDVASFVASEVTSNVRELEGALTRLAAMASLHHSEVTVEFAASVLEPHLKDRARLISVDDVQRAVCAQFGLPLSEMKSKRRTQAIASARQVAMYLSRKLLAISYPQIGQKFGGRDHTTVMHAEEVVERRLEQDPALRSAVEGLERSLGKRPA